MSNKKYIAKFKGFYRYKSPNTYYSSFFLSMAYLFTIVVAVLPVWFYWIQLITMQAQQEKVVNVYLLYVALPSYYYIERTLNH